MIHIICYVNTLLDIALHYRRYTTFIIVINIVIKFHMMIHK